jgi:hypothetical protein
LSDVVEAIGLFDVTRSGAGVRVSARKKASTPAKAAAKKASAPTKAVAKKVSTSKMAAAKVSKGQAPG